MKPLIRKPFDDRVINSIFHDLLYGSKVLSIPLIRCDNRIFNRVIEQEVIEDQVFNRSIKEEYIGELGHKNDRQLLQTGSKVLPFPLNRCGIQEFNGDIKQETIDSKVLNGIVKEEVIDESDYKDDNQLLQTGSRVLPSPFNKCGIQAFNGDIKQEPIDSKVFNRSIKEEVIDESDYKDDNQLLQLGIETGENSNTIDKEIKIEIDIIDDYEFKGIVNRENSPEIINCMNAGKTSNLREKFSTDICDKRSTAANLTKHSKINTGEKPYICNTCDKGFLQKINLKVHIRSHTGDKPYKCDLCNSGFSTSSNLKIHKRKHTKYKPFKCDLCDKHFSQSSNLTRHTLTHKGIKPYKCDFCDKGFTTNNYLTKHTKTHTGKKLHKCDFCDKHFATSSSLKIHVRKHTDEKQFKCDVCDKIFSRLSNLTRHKRNHSD